MMTQISKKMKQETISLKAVIVAEMQQARSIKMLINEKYLNLLRSLQTLACRDIF